MKAIRATEEWQRAGVHYVRVEGMLREFDIPLSREFDTDTPETKYILVLDGNFPVGTCRLHLLDNMAAQIERVVVIGEYRGRGVGRLAIEEAEKWLKEEGIRKIRIHSRECAIEFYEKCGYRTDYSQSEGEGDFKLFYTEKEI